MNRGFYGTARPLVMRRLRRESYCIIAPPTRVAYAAPGHGDPDLHIERTRCWMDHFDKRQQRGWSLSPTGSIYYDINKTWPSHIYCRSTGASQALTLFVPWAPPGDCSVTAKLRLSLQASSFQVLMGIDDGVNNFVTCKFVPNGSLGLQMNMLIDNAGSFADTGTAGWVAPGEVYCHVQRIGTTWSTWYSRDGWSWARQTTATKSLTAARIRCDILSNGASGYTGQESGIDWLKRNWVIFN